MPDVTHGQPIGETVLAVITWATMFLLFVALVLAGVVAYLRALNERKALRWAALETRWEPLVLSALSGGSAARLYRAVEAKDRWYFVGFLLRYARRLKGEELASVRALASPFLPGLLPELKSRSPERRARAVHTLASLGMPGYTPAVVEALRDPSLLVAMVAAGALLREARHEQIDAVLEVLPRFNRLSRIFIARALAEAGPEGAPSLRRMYGNRDRDPAIRAVAGEALRELADIAAADLAARVAMETENRELLAVSLRLLGDLGRPEHLPVTERGLTSDDPVIRGAAAQAFATLGGVEENRMLEDLLRDPSPWVALHAAEGLAKAGSYAPLEALARSDAPQSALAAEVLERR